MNTELIERLRNAARHDSAFGDDVREHASEQAADTIESLQEALNQKRESIAHLLVEVDALKRDAERYRWLTVNAYVGIAPHPKLHEVWCLRLPNPHDCANLDAAIDAAMGGAAA
jgi:hypothetical protein